ncbi:PdmS protein [Xylogone sp. PMI_703]|nr:PdmS protein [Xylogone sp. PMI_703]
MKFLIATMPFAGHVNPAQPIAKELVARGHEVWWLTGEEYQEKVEVTGATFVPHKHIPSFTDIPVEPDPGTSGIASAVSVLRRLFIDRIAGQVADYQSILKTFKADVILADLCSYGAATLRDLGGPVYATLGINPLVTLDPECPMYGTGAQPPKTILGRSLNRLGQALAIWFFFSKLTVLLNKERERLNLPPLPGRNGFYEQTRSRSLHILQTTPAFEFPRNFTPNIRFVGPLFPIHSKAFAAPSWWPSITTEKGSKKVVHVTQGTYTTDTGNLIRPTIDALANESDILLVVTTPDADTAFADSSSLPSNILVAPFIPHMDLLPHVDVMVTNAGYNGVLIALKLGVPLVCAGRTEDKADVSSRVAWSGAGIDLATDKPSKKQISGAVREILKNRRYGEAARKVKGSFDEHDGPKEAADLLEKLARDGKLF